MLDGIRSGVTLEMNEGVGITVSADTYTAILDAIQKTQRYVGRGECGWTTVGIGGSDARVECNKMGGRFFLNVNGNPISFLTGQNVVGECDLPRTVLRLYQGVERAIRQEVSAFQFPAEVRMKVKGLDIQLHSLAFAMYTSELGFTDWGNVRFLLDAVEMMFSTFIAGERQTVKGVLGLAVERSGDFSLLVRRFTATGEGKRKNYWSFRLYNKFAEVSERGAGGVQAGFVRGRLRLDVTLSGRWFRQNRIRTLADLHAHITATPGGTYSGWVTRMVEKIFLDTRIAYLLTFPFPADLDPGSFREWFASYVEGENEPPSQQCRKWFMDQGFDVMLPMSVHSALCVARSTFSVAGTKDSNLACVGDKAAEERVVEKFRGGLRNPKFLPVLRRVPLLQPDLSFGGFQLLDNRFVDMETGEILE